MRASVVLLTVISSLLIPRTNAQDTVKRYYRNRWTVKISAGKDVIENIAKREGFQINGHEIDVLPGLYFLSHSKHPPKVDFIDEELTRKLLAYDEVLHAEQQLIKHSILNRVPIDDFGSFHHLLSFWNPGRGYFTVRRQPTFQISPELLTCARTKDPSTKSIYSGVVNDKLYPAQWYIHACPSSMNDQLHDMNVIPVWYDKNFGQGVKVIVIDDGIETTHDELKDNFDPRYGLDLIDGDSTPDPHNDAFIRSNHGTKSAGVIAMKANNYSCGAGIAPLVTLGAVRYFDGPFKDGDAVEDSIIALTFKVEEIDITSNSWTTNDDGATLEYPSAGEIAAFKAGAEKGRGGKGVIHVFAAGNGRIRGDHCGADMFANSMYTITVASSNYEGKENTYSERCAAVMVTAYSGDGSNPYNVVSVDLNNQCTLMHTGTSAAVPMISAIIALTIKTNPKLTWREVQHLLAFTSQVGPLQNNPRLWRENGAGFWVSEAFGFGMVDAAEMNTMAKTFKPLPPMHACVLGGLDPWRMRSPPVKATFSRNVGISLILEASACAGTPQQVNYLEHLQVKMYVTYPKRGDIQIRIRSPKGTAVKLLDVRPTDYSPEGLKMWTFDSVLTWGENPKGKWIVDVYDTTSSGVGVGRVAGLYLAFFGTKDKPYHYKDLPRKYKPFTLGNQTFA